MIEQGSLRGSVADIEVYPVEGRRGASAFGTSPYSRKGKSCLS